MEMLGLSTRGLDSWIAREKITTYRLSGRLIRFDRAEVDAALERAAKRAPVPASGACAPQ